MAFQSLYRRFRPQRFSEVIGQSHLVSALRNAVVEDRVGHAYLLSGPRGTGKTSTARILAKALNCENLSAEGEPCGECQSCVAVEAGNSMDLVELDAASNNRVENVRELTTNAALASPGRRKVYLLDEVHMLSTAASNALLKTLEEPPGHVVFILATTDPQKVLPTIRSRTQHLELQLVGADVLADHVRSISSTAGLDVDAESVDYVVARGGGSVRDTLSALDQVVAAGGVPDDRISVDGLVDALANRDLTASLTAVAAAVAAGVDARDLAERCAKRLRDMFLIAADVDPGQLPSADIEALRDAAARLGRPMNVRALELVGASLVDMRQAPDPRLTFEVALVRLFADPGPGPGGPAGGSGAVSAEVSAAVSEGAVAELAARVERLEQSAAGGAGSEPTGGALPGASELASAVAATIGTTDPTPPPPVTEPQPERGRAGGASAARAALAEARGETPAAAAPVSAPAPPQQPSAAPPPPPAPAPPAPAPAAASTPAPPPPPAPPTPTGSQEAPEAAPAPDVPPPPPPEPPVAGPDEPAVATAASAADPADVSHGLISEKWPDVLLRLGLRAKARFQAAELLRVEGSAAVFELPNEVHRDRCEQVKGEVEAVVAEVVGQPVELRLVAGRDDGMADRGPAPHSPADAAAAPAPSDEPIDLDALRDAPPDGRSTVDRITDAFPGATVVDTDPGQ